MSDQQPDPGAARREPADEPESGDSTRSMAPFIIAAVIAALVLAVIVIAELVSPVEKNVTEADRVAAAVRDFGEVSSRYGLLPPEESVCPDFDPKRSPMAGRLDEGETGKAVEITKLEDLKVEGGRATATVSSKVDGAEATGTWTLKRVDNTWLVCH
ncbi:hypothetical protein IU421_12420 [Nocardia cyriacigeorgica]|uniref:Rv0361 family membrane protein n=1 Tax=Nocardia cyriacigeorgica TaxID=135487 RepID=UPI001893E419|nr:hypothetical protein [Nocardia cyriacigeorgica]MBF6159547.1 hypothetical protein [Nocardia cyriacigeorgica]MBF6198630.1 hypothetical protein [Nocardia cyriacigeorgica]MBF6315910.1 hypothetical protein [Nocardia cyriacigeorgica]MBF6515085.1 hypothetical protein [Nocardia cyriacigeorgica]MBF6530695.1 hypothetical protein [Nocardia cyriacigeorgica]